MSFTHPKDIAQAMLSCATNQSVPSGVYLLKSFDAAPDALAKELCNSVGVSADIGHPGFLSKSSFFPYTTEQLRGSLKIDAQESWKTLGYLPKYDLGSTCKEIALWYGKERWVTEGA
jgi:nucleoside-diphosphate-sugar epimerase